MPHRSLDQLSHDEKLAFINAIMEEQRQQGTEYLEMFKATWPAKAKPPETKIKNSPAHARLLASDVGSAFWQRHN